MIALASESDTMAQSTALCIKFSSCSRAEFTTWRFQFWFQFHEIWKPMQSEIRGILSAFQWQQTQQSMNSLLTIRRKIPCWWLRKIWNIFILSFMMFVAKRIKVVNQVKVSVITPNSCLHKAEQNFTRYRKYFYTWKCAVLAFWFNFLFPPTRNNQQELPFTEFIVWKCYCLLNGMLFSEKCIKSPNYMVLSSCKYSQTDHGISTPQDHKAIWQTMLESTSYIGFN